MENINSKSQNRIIQTHLGLDVSANQSYAVYAPNFIIFIRRFTIKKFALAQDALELYAEKFMTIGAIAKKLRINEKTLRRWKKADNWEEKRYRFIKTQSSLHQDLFKLGRVLLKSIKNDMAIGQKIEPPRMYFAMKIFNLLKVVKAYEDEIAAEKRKMAETKPKGLTPDVIREIEESVLVIHYEE